MEKEKEKTDLLQGLGLIPWENLEHAYGSARDVPDLLRNLLNPDPEVRRKTIWTLYGNVFHQGTRYPATPYVVPFLIKMCASPEIYKRGDLLGYWASLITGYFSIEERPWWGDGRHIYFDDQVQECDASDPYIVALHQIYLESLRGHSLVCRLLATDEDPDVRAQAASVLACLRTMGEISAPKLETQLQKEPSGQVRAAITFALGELNVPSPLWRILTEDTFPAARCMAACQLARIHPTEALFEPLLQFVCEPIKDYEQVPGAGGRSTGDAAFSISRLPKEIACKAIPSILDRLDQAFSFDTMPLVTALLSIAFTRREEPLTELTPLQKHVVTRMVRSEELWSIGNLYWTLKAHGLSSKREECAKLIDLNHDNT
jgi:hypothetical protein